MSLVSRATLAVACTAAVAALATTSTAAEISPSGGASLTPGVPAALPAPDGQPTPIGETVPTGAAPLNGRWATSKRVSVAPALPGPIHTRFSGPAGPSGGVALFPLAHIAPRVAPQPARGRRQSATWTVRLAGRRVTFTALAAPAR